MPGRRRHGGAGSQSGLGSRLQFDCNLASTNRFFCPIITAIPFSADAAKADRPEEVMASGGQIGLQVLNEVLPLLHPKREASSAIRTCCYGRREGSKLLGWVGFGSSVGALNRDIRAFFPKR